LNGTQYDIVFRGMHISGEKITAEEVAADKDIQALLVEKGSGMVRAK
jgi:hypothetical protein